MGKRQGDPCIMNLWVHDGSKDITVNRLRYRELLKDSLPSLFCAKLSQQVPSQSQACLPPTMMSPLLHRQSLL